MNDASSLIERAIGTGGTISFEKSMWRSVDGAQRSPSLVPLCARPQLDLGSCAFCILIANPKLRSRGQGIVGRSLLEIDGLELPLLDGPAAADAAEWWAGEATIRGKAADRAGTASRAGGAAQTS
jgi:hypothetical protein